MAIVIRPAEDSDAAAIFALHAAAFPTDAEARLVAGLDSDGAMVASLVAVRGSVIAGHVAFSRMAAVADGLDLPAAALGPVAVAAAYRGQSLASVLIEQGLAAVEDAGVRIVFVLGDVEFYARFGFEAALAARFASPYAGDHWQALWLGEEKRVRAGGARHAAAFAALG